MISKELELKIKQVSVDANLIINWLNNIDKPNKDILVFLGKEKTGKSWLVNQINKEFKIMMVYPGLEKYIDKTDNSIIYVTPGGLYHWNKFTKPNNLIIVANYTLLESVDETYIGPEDITYSNFTFTFGN
jgi:hypothetical protein